MSSLMRRRRSKIGSGRVWCFVLFAMLVTGWSEAKLSPYEDLIQLYSRRYNLDWLLVTAQVWAESNFDPLAESPVGARGLMQIMPGTARWLGVDPNLLWEPEINIRLGTYYDAKLYAIFKKEKGQDRVAFMLAAYNAGPGRVIRAQKKAIVSDQWNDGRGIKKHLPRETQRYVEKIFKRWTLYRFQRR